MGLQERHHLVRENNTGKSLSNNDNLISPWGPFKSIAIFPLRTMSMSTPSRWVILYCNFVNQKRARSAGLLNEQRKHARFQSHGIARPTAEGAVGSRYLLDSSSMERSQIYGNQTIKVRAVLGLNMFTISLLVSLRNCLQKFSNGIVNRR